MRKTIVVSLVLLLLFLAGAIWPFAAIYDIALKAEAGDAAGLSERIDFTAVRRSQVLAGSQNFIRIIYPAIGEDQQCASTALARRFELLK